MAKYTKEDLLLLWLDGFEGLLIKHKREIYQRLKDADSIKTAVESAKDYIVDNCGEKTFDTLLLSANNEFLKYVVSTLERDGITAVTINSDDYPALLKETDCPPLVLYCKGDVSLLNSACFSIVGSRRSLPISIKLAEEYAESLGKEFTLVTGIAEGVDSAVLRTALKTGAKVISVTAGGHNSVYPKENIELFSEVEKHGLTVSEYRPEVVPEPYFFPARNRIIAGLSKGVLIVSGGVKSGTAYTAGYAGDYGRDVFAIPYTPGISSGAGCNNLLKQGAILTDSPSDVLDFYGKTEKEEKTSFTEEESEIIKTLKDGELHIDKICEALGKEIYDVMPILSILEIKGVVVKSGTNVYGTIKKYSEE